MSFNAKTCTTILVTKGASADGSVFVTHSNDGYIGDPNVVFVPARDHEKCKVRFVYPSPVATGEMSAYNCFFNPHLVAPARSEGYDFPGKPFTKPIGKIPEVEHTYAYIDGEYPVVNEHGLMMGECTDTSARLREVPYKEGGGIFYSSELGRVALERCKTAREAIILMGALIDKYGLYGTAETLIVADSNEGWVMEMMPTPSRYGGFWIAEKIPDGHFFIAANQLRIRAIREGDPNQIFNPKLPQMLKENFWAVYDDRGNLDWVKSLRGDEFFHPYYSMRRVWRAMDLVAPSKKFSSKVNGWDSDYYPLSICPDEKLELGDVINLYRDYYRGTKFDKTRSKFAGIHGSPYHYDCENSERAIFSADTSCTYIAQVNDELPAPIFWLSTNTPLDNPFVPFTVAKMPEAYNHILRKEYDGSKMWWASNQIKALAGGYYRSFGKTVEKAIHQVEKNSFNLVKSSLNLSEEKFAEALNENALKIFDAWKKLYEKILIRYDGGAGIDYDKKNLPKSEIPNKY